MLQDMLKRQIRISILRHTLFRDHLQVQKSNKTRHKPLGNNNVTWHLQKTNQNLHIHERTGTATHQDSSLVVHEMHGLGHLRNIASLTGPKMRNLREAI